MLQKMAPEAVNFVNNVQVNIKNDKKLSWIIFMNRKAFNVAIKEAYAMHFGLNIGQYWLKSMLVVAFVAALTQHMFTLWP